MATQPDISPDRIDPAAPPESPVIQPPSEAPTTPGPEIVPDRPDTIDPGGTPAETPATPSG